MGFFGNGKNKEEKQKTKIIEAAQKFARKGQIDKAVAEWQNLLKNKPDDANVYNTIGDLYLKGSRKNQAIESYNKACTIFKDSGFSLKSIAVNKKILKLDPNNLDALDSMAQLHKERGMIINAKECYLSIAAYHIRAGGHDKALEAYQQIVDMEPKNLNVKLSLAELYLKEQMVQEGSKIYAEVIGELLERERYEDAEKLCKRLEETLSSPSAVVRYMVQIHLARGNIDEAYESFKHLEVDVAQDSEIAVLKAEILIRKGHAEEGLTVLQSIDRRDVTELSQLKIFRHLLEAKELSQALEVLDDLAEKYTTSRRLEELLALYQQVLKHDADQLKARQRMIDLLKKMKRNEEVIQQYKEMGRTYASSGQIEEARNIYEKVLDMTPGDLEVQAQLKELSPETAQAKTQEFGEVVLDAGSEGGTGDGAPARVTVIDDEMKIETFETVTAEAAEEPPLEFSPPVVELSDEGVEEIEVVQEEDEDLETLLQDNITEADVYMKYGHMKKAMVHLEKNLEIGPRHIPTHERLLQIFVELDNAQEQINTLMILARRYQEIGELEKHEATLNQLLALDPENELAQQNMEEGPEVLSSSAVGEAPAETANLNFEFDDAKSPGAPSAVEETHEGVELSGDLEASEESVDDLLDEANFYLQNGMIDEARVIYEKVLALHPQREDIAKQLEEIAGNGMKEAAPPDEISKIFSEVAEEILDDEQESVSLEGQEETVPLDAAETQETKPVSAPSDDFSSFAEELQQEMDLSVSDIMPQSEEVPETADETDDFSSELRREVEESIASDGHLFDESDVMEIFSEFREGVRRELGDEDHETHYNLGIAYLEMGLLDEAREEFSIAGHNPKRLMDCITMVGLCYIQKGEFQKALTELEKGLVEEGRTEDEYIGVRYEIVKVCEQLGDLVRARQELLRIYEANPRYRDVARKLNDLGISGSEKPPGIINVDPKKNKVSYL